jgi:ATPase family protein associated with various cellular activities (AAA)
MSPFTSSAPGTGSAPPGAGAVAPPPADRGAVLLRRARVARATHQPLAISGHVDDLLPAPDGRALRLPEVIALGGVSDGLITVVGSETTGATTLTPPGAARPARQVSVAPAGLAELLDQLLSALPGLLGGHPAQLLLLGGHSALEHDDGLAEQLRDLPFDRRLADGQLHVLAAFRAAEPAALQGATGWETHRIPLPDAAERRGALGYWERISVIDGGTLGTEELASLDDLATVTGGLELDDLRRLTEEHAKVEPLTPHRISEVRSAALARQLGDLVHVDHRPATRLDDVVGGEAAKAAAWERRRDGWYPPLALVGPPGTGKTLLGNGIANALGFPIIFIDSRLKGGFVGDTGRNLSRLRELLIAYAPVVAFWDEIDLLLGRSTDWNGDSGASNEVRQATLTLLQDAPGLGIFVIASSNNPLSALQYRVRNRMHLIPVLHPAGDDAVEIARREAAKRDVTLTPDAAELIRSADDVLWNGRDIARMIASARSNVLRLGGPRARLALSGQVELTAADLQLLVRHLAAARDDAAVLNALEAVYVLDNPFDLPWIARQIARGERPPLPSYLTEFIGPDGLPNRKLIAERLAAAGVTDVG